MKLGARRLFDADRFVEATEVRERLPEVLSRGCRDVADPHRLRDLEPAPEDALGLLEESLRVLRTDHLDLWQMHDLRTMGDLDAMFDSGGAIEAAEAAKKAGKIRFIGLTGHHDPDILLAAMDRYAFDNVLLPINPADPARRPFVTTVIPKARAQGMGVVGMKVLAAGQLVADGAATAEECIRYAMAHADTLIIGCSSIAEVRANLRVGRTKAPMTKDEQLALESRIARRASRYASFKA